MHTLHLVLFALSAVLTSTWGHFGRCPIVEPIPGLNMDKMLGTWYVILDSDMESECLIYNIKRGIRRGEFVLEQSSNRNSISRRLTVKDRSKPGTFMIHFPFSKASFTVFMSDHETYAGIFTCNNMGLFHKPSGTIISRYPNLDAQVIDEIKTNLSKFKVNVSKMTYINHDYCPMHPRIDVKSGGDTKKGPPSSGGQPEIRDENSEVETLA